MNRVRDTSLLVFFLIACFWAVVIILPSKPFSDPLWELIPTPSTSQDIMRTPVPHGWIVAYKRSPRNITYIPDERHEWKIK